MQIRICTSQCTYCDVKYCTCVDMHNTNNIVIVYNCLQLVVCICLVFTYENVDKTLLCVSSAQSHLAVK